MESRPPRRGVPAGRGRSGDAPRTRARNRSGPWRHDSRIEGVAPWAVRPAPRVARLGLDPAGMSVLRGVVPHPPGDWIARARTATRDGFRPRVSDPVASERGPGDRGPVRHGKREAPAVEERVDAPPGRRDLAPGQEPD